LLTFINFLILFSYRISNLILVCLYVFRQFTDYLHFAFTPNNQNQQHPRPPMLPKFILSKIENQKAESKTSEAQLASAKQPFNAYL